MSGISTYIGGAWKATASISTYIGGWKPVATIWVWIGGAWKVAYSAMTLSLNLSSVTVHTGGGFVGCTVSGPSSGQTVEATVSGGTAPITLSLTYKSGIVPNVINPSSAAYPTAALPCNAVFQSPQSGACVLTVTATDANGVTASQDFTCNVVSP